MEYRAYGLDISSNVEIPALRGSSESHCDIQVEIGPAPAWVAAVYATPGHTAQPLGSPDERADSKLRITKYDSGKFLELRYDDGTRFLMDECTTRIWGQPGPGLSQDDVFVYLVGPVIGFVLRRRKKLALHASSVKICSSAIVLSGEAGSGKSTTAAALALRGHPLLCDDVCVLEDARSTKQVIPGYPRICLWPDSVSYLFSSSEAALPCIVRGWDKRYLALDGKYASFAVDKSPLAAVYLLAARSESQAAPHVEPLSPKDSVLQLVKNTYMNYLLTKDQRAVEFYAIAELVREVECFRVTPSADPARLGDLASLIESHALGLISRKELAVTPAVSAGV